MPKNNIKVKRSNINMGARTSCSDRVLALGCHENKQINPDLAAPKATGLIKVCFATVWGSGAVSTFLHCGGGRRGQGRAGQERLGAGGGTGAHTRVCVCVCVCHPLFLRVLRSTHFNPAGACDTLILSHATKLWIRVGRETSPVSCTCDVNS